MADGPLCRPSRSSAPRPIRLPASATRGEQLATGHVQRRPPQAREPGLVQACRTLRRALDSGKRHPRLRAAMGLCESDAGHEAERRKFLELASAAGGVRLRA